MEKQAWTYGTTQHLDVDTNYAVNASIVLNFVPKYFPEQNVYLPLP